jgi:hypothetical protein
VKTGKGWRVKKRRWCHLIDLVAPLQTTPIIPTKKGIGQPEDAFEDTAVKRGLKLSDSKPDFRVSSIHSFVN